METRQILYLAVALSCIISCKEQPKNDYSWEKDLSERLAADFCKSRDEIKKEISKYIPSVTDAQIDAWTESGSLESMEIDGRRMTFQGQPRTFSWWIQSARS